MQPASTGDYTIRYQHIIEYQPLTDLLLILAAVLLIYPAIHLVHYLIQPERSWLDRLPLSNTVRRTLAGGLALLALVSALVALVPNPLNPSRIETVSTTSPVTSVVVDTVKDRRNGFLYYGEYGKNSVKIADTTPLTKIFPEESLNPATDVITLIKANSKTYYFEGYVPEDRLSQMMFEFEMTRVKGTTTPDVVGYMSDVQLEVK